MRERRVFPRRSEVSRDCFAVQDFSRFAEKVVFLLSMFLACSYKSLNTKLNGTLRRPRPAVSTYYIKNRGLLLGVM